jgi:hypothetical protein
MTYTNEQVQEIIRCKDDPVYFIENYVKTVCPHRGKIPMKLYPNQKETIGSYHYNRCSTIREDRQKGVTQSLVAYLCWWVVFNGGKTSIVMSHRQRAAIEILNRVMFAYDNLPEHFKKGLIHRNKTSIQFEDDTALLASAPNLSSIRGRAFDILMIDNYEYIKRDVVDEIYESVIPVISASRTGKFITASTR